MIQAAKENRAMSAFAAFGFLALKALLYAAALVPALVLYYLALVPGAAVFMAAYLVWLIVYCGFSTFLSIRVRSGVWRIFLLCPLALLVLFHAVSFGTAWGDPSTDLVLALFHSFSLFVLSATAISILMKLAAGNRGGF